MAIRVTYEDVALDDLVMESFQRRTDAARVREYVRDYDPCLSNPPVVAALTNGKKSVLDGAHTVDVERAAHPNKTHIFCRVLHGLSKPLRADRFLKLNEKRVRCRRFSGFTRAWTLALHRPLQ